MALGVTTLLRTTLVVGPPDHLCADGLYQFLHAARVKGALLSVPVLEKLLTLPCSTRWLGQLRLVHYVNGSLSVSTRRKLCRRHVFHLPFYCSPEAGVYLTRFDRQVRLLSYASFWHYSGVVFEERMQGLHELVFVKSDQCLHGQIFLLYPDLDRFPSGELWLEHPVHYSFWVPVCRALDHIEDPYRVFDKVVLAIMTGHENVDTAFVEWRMFRVPLIFVQFHTSESAMETLKPYIDYINRCNDLYPGEVSIQYLVQTSYESPFPQNYNGEIHRWVTFKDHKARIVELGLEFDPDSNGLRP